MTPRLEEKGGEGRTAPAQPDFTTPDAHENLSNRSEAALARRSKDAFPSWLEIPGS